jgi:hypothetical protein
MLEAANVLDRLPKEFFEKIVSFNRKFISKSSDFFY